VPLSLKRAGMATAGGEWEVERLNRRIKEQELAKSEDSNKEQN
jgi:hypothetical protein